MLSIKVNNNKLITPDNIRIAITGINPMLVRKRGSNSLNFSLPGKNRKYLEAPHLSGVKRTNEHDAEISFRSFKKTSKLFFDTLSKDQYACSINIDETIYYEEYGEKSIRELNLGGARDYSNYPGNYHLYRDSSDDADFVMFKFRNDSFLNSTMHEGSNNYQNNQDNNPFFDLSVPRTPFIYICYLYEELFHEYGYTVEYNHLREDPHFKKLALYTNQSANDNGTDLFLASHLPDITNIDLINAISDFLNVHPLINDTTKEVYLVSLEQKLKFAKVIDVTKYTADDLTKSNEELATKVTFKMAVESNDANQNPHKYLADQINLNIQAPVDTVANLPADAAGTIRLVTDTNWYYKREVDNGGVYSWEKYAKNIQVVESGSGDIEHEIAPKLTAVQLRSDNGEVDPVLVSMEGNTPFRNDPKKIPLMIGFFHNTNGSYGLWNNSGEAEEISLTPESIFNYCFKNTANMMVNSFQPYECTLRFPPAVLNNFDYSAIYKIYDTQFLIEELNYNIEIDKITYEPSKLRAI